MAKEMIRRKDGSYSQRGLWDNIRANRGSGKKPTSQMLKQEKKIKMATAKKAQKGVKATADSSAYFRRKGYEGARDMVRATSSLGLTKASNKIAQADKDLARQKRKGKPGYDKNGFPLKKSQFGSQIKAALTNRPKKTKTKERVAGGNYVKKTVVREYSGPDTYGTKTRVKTRRTARAIGDNYAPGTVKKTKNITKYSRRTGAL